MQWIQKLIVVLLVVSLVGCTSKSESQSTSPSKEAVSVWHYDGSQTVVPLKKEETVTVEADASGTPLKTTVQTKLSDIQGNQVIEDTTDLKDLNVLYGEEQFEEKSGKVYFENRGQSISYTGTSDKSLPISVQVSYFLDDRQMSPAEMAGKKGHVRIRFDYINTSSYEGIHVPFLCMSTLLFSDAFSNVSVTNGKVINQAGSFVVVGYAIPCLGKDIQLDRYEDLDFSIPEYVEVEADTSAFELDFTETFITKGLFSEIDQNNMQDLHSLTDSFKDVGEVGDALKKGGSEVNTAYTSLQSGISEYLDGVDSLAEGIDSLEKGVDSMTVPAKDLSSAAMALSAAINSVDISSLEIESSTLFSEIRADVEDIASLSNEIQTLLDSEATLEEKVTALTKDDPSLTKEFTECFETIKNTILSMQQTLQKSVEDLNSRLQSIDTEKMSEMQVQFSQLQSAASDIANGTETLSENMQGLEDGVDTLVSSAQKATAYDASLKKGMAQFSDGLTVYMNGVDMVNAEVLQKLKEKAGENGSELLSSIEKVREAEKSYQVFTQLSNGQAGSVVFEIETAKISK